MTDATEEVVGSRSDVTAFFGNTMTVNFEPHYRGNTIHHGVLS